jgi:hypothetical protein
MNYTIIILLLVAVFFLKNKNTTENTILKPKIKEVEIVTPHFVYEALNNREHNILLVNVLSDHIKYKISLNGFNDIRSLTKQEFEKMLENNNNQIPKGIEKVIIYCAGWSCSGAKNYYKKMIENGVNVDKVVDYIGAIHEWATYSDITPSIFTFHSTETNQVLNVNEVRDIRINTAHDYFVDNVLPSGYIKTLSQSGKTFKSYL